MGLEKNDQVFTENYYAAELNSEWTKLCTLRGEKEGILNGYPVYKDKMKAIPTTNYEYWLDFIEDSPFNINNIGRRSKVLSDNAVNCIYTNEFDNYIYILADGDVERITKERDIAAQLGKPVIQVNETIYNHMTLGGGKTSAYDKIKELLYTHMTYNETINLSTVPIYHLEPNTRITIFDNETGVNGDYMIKTISLPLTFNGTSSISATKCIDKTF